MGGREHIVSQIWPLIERYAGDFDGYLVDESALKRLKDTSEFPAAIIDPITRARNAILQDKELFDDFITGGKSSSALDLNEDEREIVADASQ